MRSKFTLSTLFLAMIGASAVLAGSQFTLPQAKSPDLVSGNPSHTLRFNPNATAMPMLSDGDVGDADSFGSKVLYIGLLGGGEVYLQEDCTGFTLGPNDRCVTLNA